jgi:hypothetical protein
LNLADSVTGGKSPVTSADKKGGQSFKTLTAFADAVGLILFKLPAYLLSPT